MTLQQLEYVVAVAEHRHFLKAAEACDVTQPTLSSMVQKLEEELGVKIFNRRIKPIALTPVGETIVAEARQTLVQAQRLKASVDEAQHSPCGTFSIGVLPTIAPYLIPRFYPEFSRRYPDVELHITEMKTSSIKAALTNGDIDAGILANMEGLDDFLTQTLFYEQYFVYAAHDTPLSQLPSVKTNDLREVPLWLLDEGHCFRDQLMQFCQLKSGRRSQRSYHLGSIETFMRMVENGVGVTFIPELCTFQLSAEQRTLVRPFAVPVPTREVVFLTSPDFVRHSIQQILVESIRQSVPQEMHHLSKVQKHVN